MTGSEQDCEATSAGAGTGAAAGSGSDVASKRAGGRLESVLATAAAHPAQHAAPARSPARQCVPMPVQSRERRATLKDTGTGQEQLCLSPSRTFVDLTAPSFSLDAGQTHGLRTRAAGYGSLAAHKSVIGQHNAMVVTSSDESLAPASDGGSMPRQPSRLVPAGAKRAIARDRCGTAAAPSARKRGRNEGFAWLMLLMSRGAAGARVAGSRAARDALKFTELLDNWKWRNKVFKNTQYTGKIVLWLMARYAVDKQHPEFAKRLKTTTKVLSLVRRFQVALAWMEDLADLREAIADRDPVLIALYATSFVTDAADDILTLAKANIIDGKKVPPSVERTAEIFWGVSCVFSIWKAVRKYRKAAAQLAAAQRQHTLQSQRTGERTSSTQGPPSACRDASSVGAAGDTLEACDSAVRTAVVGHKVAVAGLAKSFADCGQSIPGAFAWEWYPDIADHLSGWTSGLLSTYQLWVQG